MSIQKWIIDPNNSEISFNVKHLVSSTVTGYFRKFNLTLETEGNDFNTAKNIEFTAEIDSIDTGDVQRDTHLRSADFFNGKINKNLKFSGYKYEGSGNDAKVTGNLTIGAITKAVTTSVIFGGTIIDDNQKANAKFTITAKISRKDFGLTWSAITEAGTIVVGDEVKINAKVQIIQQD